METLKEKITGLNELLQNGKLLDAFEKYYHEDVSMQENELPPPLARKPTVKENSYSSRM